VLYSRISNIKSGGDTSQPPLPISFFASWLPLHQHAKLSAYKPQRKVLFGTQQAHGILSPLSVSRKGGEGTGEDDLHSDTSLVHSQLQVRGGVLAWDSTTVTLQYSQSYT
jgi:hypothetical protein